MGTWISHQPVSQSSCLLFFFCLPVYLCLSVCLSLCMSACLSLCLSLCLSVYLSVCLSVYLSVCLSVCLSVSLSLSSSPPPHPPTHPHLSVSLLVVPTPPLLSLCFTFSLFSYFFFFNLKEGIRETFANPTTQCIRPAR